MINPTDIEALQETRASEQLNTLYAINDVLKAVGAEGFTLENVIPLVLELAMDQLDAADGSIILVNDELEVQYSWQVNRSFHDGFTSEHLQEVVRHGLAGAVLRSGKAATVPNTTFDDRWLQSPQAAKAKLVWSALCAPFNVHERTVGVITLLKAGENRFSTQDADLLMLIADQAASTVENARLLADSQRQLDITRLLNEASKVINSSLEINAIMQELLTQMNEFLRAEAVSIALVDPATNELVYEAAEGVGSGQIIGLRLPSNQGLSGWVMEHAEPALVHNTAEDPRFRDRLGVKRTGYETRAMICAPMQFKGRVLGTIQAINPVDGRFNSQDLSVLVSLANIASSAIANAKQYKRAQIAESRYMSLFQDSVDPIILTDVDGIIVEANQRAFDLFGYEREELVGMPIISLHTGYHKLAQVAAVPGDTVHKFVSEVVPKQSSQCLHLEVYAKRTPYGSDELLQWIHHDITKQVELEAMRQDLTAMLVHDLQSPLGNVISSLELIHDEMEGDGQPALAAMLDIAMRSSQHLQTLVNSLLDISRLEAGHPVSKQTNVDLSALLDIVYEIEEPNFERRGVKFVRELQANLPPLFVEESMLRRVLLNLLDNALKYSENNRQITVTAKRHPQEESMVLVTVVDQGRGIPAEYRTAVFEKFQRIATSSESKGLGLGLAFCRLAVEAHGGKIWVDDAPMGGARFSFTVPAGEQDAG